MATNLGWLKESLKPSTLATRDDLIWAAGIFEGEGYCYRPNNRTEQVEIDQKGRWLVDKLRDLFGGSVYDAYGDGMYVWKAMGARARGFLQSIYGLLSPRRQEQIRKALMIGEFCIKSTKEKEL